MKKKKISKENIVKITCLALALLMIIPLIANIAMVI